MLSLAFCELEWQMFCCSCGPKWKAEGYVTEGSVFFNWSRRRSKDSREPRRRHQLPLRYTKNLEMVRYFLEESDADKENTSRLQ